MTWRRYRRLTLVLILPLLLAGWLTARAMWSHNDLFATCEEQSTFENCRNVGWTGSLHDYVIKSQPAWFDIQPAELDTSPAAMPFSGSRRSFYGAEVVAAEPFMGNGPAAASIMSETVGKRGRVLLGILKNERSTILDSAVDLACNSVSFSATPGQYEAGCYGEGWSGPVTFTLTGSEQQRMERLRQEVQAEIDKQHGEYRLFQIIMYPLFLYLFLIGSGLVWLGRVSFRYVKEG